MNNHTGAEKKWTITLGQPKKKEQSHSKRRASGLQRTQYEGNYWTGLFDEMTETDPPENQSSHARVACVGKFGDRKLAAEVPLL